jgi:hypothetical protein
MHGPSAISLYGAPLKRIVGSEKGTRPHVGRQSEDGRVRPLEG